MAREEKITADVTMLEMLSPPKLNLKWPISGLAFIETPEPEIKQYRAIYHAVGDNHFWVNRKRLTDGQLGALLYHPENYVTQLLKDNLDDEPIGSKYSGEYKCVNISLPYDELRNIPAPCCPEDQYPGPYPETLEVVPICH